MTRERASITTTETAPTSFEAFLATPLEDLILNNASTKKYATVVLENQNQPASNSFEKFLADPLYKIPELVHDVQSHQEPEITKTKRILFLKKMSAVGMAGVTLLYAEGMFNSTPNTDTFPLRAPATTTPLRVPLKSTTTSSTLVTPETTTTAKPYVPYSTNPVESALNAEGELIAPAYKVRIDAMCEDSIDIYEMRQDRVKDIGTARNATPVDVMVPDATPLTDNCERVTEYKAQNPGAITRIDRIRQSFDVVNGQRVNAAYYQPTGVHLDDKMYPGEKGNFVVMWHGSTRNAAGANTSVLRPGDTMDVTRNDGYVSVYEFVDREILTVPDEDDVSAEAIQRREEVTRIIWNYTNNSNGSTASTIRCGEKDGKTGSDEAREVGRWKLKYSYQSPTSM